MLILIGRNLKIRYRSSFLGFFWSLLTPMLLIAIYGAFAKILKFNNSHDSYLGFLIIGIVTWQFISLCIGDSLGSILGHANLIKKTRFPRIVLPLSMVIANLVNFLLTLVIVLAFLLWDPSHMQQLGWLPGVVLCQTALCLGLALFFSCMNLFFRDTEHFIGILLLAWFFLTPVFYPLQRQVEMAVSHHVPVWLLFLNPMTGFLAMYRHILISDPLGVAPICLFTSVAMSLIVLAIGGFAFMSVEARMADEL